MTCNNCSIISMPLSVLASSIIISTSLYLTFANNAIQDEVMNLDIEPSEKISLRRVDNDEVGYHGAHQSPTLNAEPLKPFSFDSAFFQKFPSLNNSNVSIVKTESPYLWKVTMDGSSVFFTSDLKVAVRGEISVIPGDDYSSVNGSSKNNLVAKNNRLVQDSGLELQEPKPPRHVGLIRKDYEDALSLIDKGMLPFYKATANRDESNPKFMITFIDSTCPACKRFLKQIPELNKLGIDVYLAPYARGGANSKTALAMEFAWCHSDNQQRMDNVDKLVSGRLVQSSCDNELYANNISKSLTFGDNYLNQTTPVSFTSNGIIVIANLEPSGFMEAFDFGERFADYLVKSKIVKVEN